MGGVCKTLKCDLKNAVTHFHIKISFQILNGAENLLQKKKNHPQPINVFVYCLISVAQHYECMNETNSHGFFFKQSIDWLVNKQLYRHTNIEIYK